MKKVKPKKCANCEKEFTPTHSTTQKVCSVNCDLEWTKKHPPKSYAKSISEADIDKKIEQFKKNIEKLSEIEALAKKIFQKWVRLRDENEPCISCQRTNALVWNGGHYKKAEMYSGVIFHPYNVNKQCARPCNHDLSGNELNYRQGLIKKIGEHEVIKLEQLANETRQYKYTREELYQIISTYKAKIKAKDFTNIFM